MRRHCNWLRRWPKHGRGWQPWGRKPSEEQQAVAEIFNFCESRGLAVVEERHEAEIHVELLVAVEEREARIVGDEVHLRFLVAA
jgi:hypothetical protein